MALLEADVNFRVARDLVSSIRERVLQARCTHQPGPGPASGKDHQRGAHLAPRGWKPQPAAGIPSTVSHPRRGAQRVGKDDHVRQARASPEAGRPEAYADRRRPPASGRHRPAEHAGRPGRSRALRVGHLDTHSGLGEGWHEARRRTGAPSGPSWIRRDGSRWTRSS